MEAPGTLLWLLLLQSPWRLAAQTDASRRVEWSPSGECNFTASDSQRSWFRRVTRVRLTPGHSVRESAPSSRSVGYISRYVPVHLIQAGYEFTNEKLDLLVDLVNVLPENFRSEFSFHGFSWEHVNITAFLRIISVAILLWIFFVEVKSAFYQGMNMHMEKEILEMIKKFCAVENKILLEKIWKYREKDLLDEIHKKLDGLIQTMQVTLESEREQNIKNQDLILKNEKSVENLKCVLLMYVSKISEVQVAPNEAQLPEAKLHQEIEDSKKMHTELTEEIQRLKMSEEHLEEALPHRDYRNDAVTDCSAHLNLLSESEARNAVAVVEELNDEARGELAGDRSGEMKDGKARSSGVSQAEPIQSTAKEDCNSIRPELRASTPGMCSLEELKKLEDGCNALKSESAAKEMELSTLLMKIEIIEARYEQRKMALEEEMRQKEREWKESKKLLSDAEKKACLIQEEAKKYKQRIEELEGKLDRADCSFRRRINAIERKGYDTWVQIHAAERELVYERRETAYLKHRLEVIQNRIEFQEGRRFNERMLGRPDVRKCPQRADPGCGAAPVMNSQSGSSVPTEGVEKDKIGMDARRPAPVHRPPFMHFASGSPLSPVHQYGPPPPPWWAREPWRRPPPPPFAHPF